MGIISESPTISHGGPATKRGQSAAQNTATGSGSRPTRSKYAIPTSAPANAHLDDTRGAGVSPLDGGMKPQR